jgi:tetratricopeptide (TPR) repeat protein
MAISIDHILAEQVREGRVVLILGAGAARGAVHPDGLSPPNGQQLADQLAAKFLGPKYVGRALEQVASLAISEANLVSVQEFIANIFRPFKPATFHKLIPTFVWSAIATTNYDLIVERAYTEVSDRCQELATFIKNGQHVEDSIRDPSHVMFLKLHGCISTTTDPHLPMILTPEQYITHRENRSRLFDRLISLAYERPLLFAGHSMADSDLRAILHEVTGLQGSLPRSFMVAPHIDDADERYWSARKFTCIKATFEEFISSLDKSLGKGRKLATKLSTATHPISRHLALPPGGTLPRSVDRLVTNDADFVHGGIASEPLDPKLFYKGYGSSWYPITANLDATRTLANTILLDYVAPSEEERSAKQELVVIKGHAGSGKSVLLRRIAWEAASPTFDRLCLYANDGAQLRYDDIHELHLLAKKRIFIFAEPTSHHRESIQAVMDGARKDKLPVTIATAERHNAWSAQCESLETHVSDSYELRYLSADEIDRLLALLERHKSLGHLEKLSQKERRQSLSEKAGRNLLVALHEATLGKPFSDIIFDEYTSIPDEDAKTLYKTVCTLHRLNVLVRAGLLSRVHGISFLSFKERLFRPLESVVFASQEHGWKDFAYRSRHPHIAEMVFERVLVNDSDRFAEYIRIIGGIDVDYESDRDALRGLVNGRELRKLFPDTAMVRKIFAAAKLRDPKNAMLLQQEAIYEMYEDLPRARELLLKARAMKPGHSAIEHSLAELNLKCAAAAVHPVEKKRYRDDARAVARSLLNRPHQTSHPYHTLIKVGQDELGELIDLIDSGKDDGSSFGARIGELEKLLSEARTRFPDDSYLLEAEATLSQSLNRHPKALATLQQAFAINRGNAFIALRLAWFHESDGSRDAAISVLKECLNANPQDKDIHFRLAALLESAGASQSEIVYHLRHSFTPGDSRHVAQFWCARALYVNGDVAQSLELFRALSETAHADTKFKKECRGVIPDARWGGAVQRVEGSYAFIKKDGDGVSLFAHQGGGNAEGWGDLARGRRVSFRIGFNYYGLVAVELRKES